MSQRKKNKRSTTKQRRRNNHSSSSRKHQAASSPLEESTALVPADTTKIRKKWIAACKRARTTFLKAQRELDQFEQEEKPAHRSWVHQNLGAELSTVRELRQQLESKNEFYRRLIMEMQLSGDPSHVCYGRLQRGESVIDQWTREWEEDDSEETGDSGAFEDDEEEESEVYSRDQTV